MVLITHISPWIFSFHYQSQALFFPPLAFLVLQIGISRPQLLSLRSDNTLRSLDPFSPITLDMGLAPSLLGVGRGNYLATELRSRSSYGFESPRPLPQLSAIQLIPLDPAT